MLVRVGRLQIRGGGDLSGWPFGSWGAMVIAGDWKGAGGGPTEAFDNARRDVSAELVRLGFDSSNILQYSVRPERYGKERLAKSDIKAIFEGMSQLAARNPEGCLVYLTTHGAPQGAIVDKSILPPGILAAILDRTCCPPPDTPVIPAGLPGGGP